MIGTLAVDGWVDGYIWYSEEGTWRGRSPPRPLLAVPNVTNVTAHPSTASVTSSYYLMWHYNCLCPLKGSLVPTTACDVLFLVDYVCYDV